MEWQSFLNLAGGLATTAIGWFANNIWTAHKELRKELNDHKVEVAKDYVPHSRLDRMMGELREMLSRIESKIDQKADK